MGCNDHLCMYVVLYVYSDLPDVLLVHCIVYMYANDAFYTNTPKENIDSCVDYINRGLVRIDNRDSTNGLCRQSF